jgi:hypothetical protein
MLYHLTVRLAECSMRSAIYQLLSARIESSLPRWVHSGMALGGWEARTVTMWETGPYLIPITSPRTRRSSDGYILTPDLFKELAAHNRGQGRSPAD